MTITPSPHKVPPPGVWAPSITFFNHSTDELDTESQAKYYSYLSRTGLTGLVILGTNAETFLLTRSERKTLLTTARSSVPPGYPIMAGVSGHSTKQVLEFISDAKEAGADYALLLPPGYFGKQSTLDVVREFYADIAERSELPIVIYNFPAVVNGVDIDSATIAELARKYGNIVGVKLTCGSVAKITRLSAEFGEEEGRFAAYAGQSDFLIGGLAAGGAGTIAGFANVFPRTIVRIYDLYTAGKIKEAMELHKIAALAEQPCKAGIASVKYAASFTTARRAGVQGAEEKLRPRRPYKELDEMGKKGVKEGIEALMGVEEALEAQSLDGSNGAK
ncbi:dihydrodipicolinate synthase family protein [Aspergillus stella-maris]|uniref:dihydrodipicolinate synthase family protein n=1 Tax=Aspergillus stella-maris TaxID=1810926 RepID=UPI003CCCB343